MNTRRPRLFIGPWIGEFGVELLRWQGLARTLANSKEWDEVIVATRPDRFYLYEDFATRFVPYSPPNINALGFSCGSHKPPNLHLDYIDTRKGDTAFSPQVNLLKRRLVYAHSACHSTYRNFAEHSIRPPKVYDILIHARATPKAGQRYKNWPSENYRNIIQSLPSSFRIASIGSVDGAHKISGTDDLRGIPLKELAAYCGHSKVVIGPSSGAIHFAMHCGSPVVTWIGQDERCNYYSQWNPMGVPFCCVSGWQPDPSVILHKIHELMLLDESNKCPVEYCVVGTKRSGHHGFIEWLVELDNSTKYFHWNDCVNARFESFPPEDHHLPSIESRPKQLHKNSTHKSIFVWNNEGRRRSRILSYEGLDVHKIRQIPDIGQSRHLIFVLRDAANLVASLKKGIPQLKHRRFLSSEMRNIINIYFEYLQEATGITHHLQHFRPKVLFVSYNRWHTDVHYRAQVARALGKASAEATRGYVSSSAHTSGFQDSSTPAANLNTLDRWVNYMEDADYWNVVSEHDLVSLEQIFHSGKTPLSNLDSVIAE